MAIANSIYGLFPGPDAAERGMKALRSSGIARERILVMSPEPFEEYDFAHADSGKSMYRIAACCGVIGGTLGFLLARFMQTAYPFPLITGAMPLVAPWPSGIVTYELTMFSAIISTVITLLITTRLPHWKQDKVYDEEVSHGMVLIGVVDPADNTRTDLENMLRHAGAAKIKGTGRFQ